MTQTSALHPSFKCTPQEVLRAVKTFPVGSSGGIDGLRPDHLKDMLAPRKGPSATESMHLKTLTAFVNLILDTSLLPLAVQPLLFGARLIPLKKKGWWIKTHRCWQYIKTPCLENCLQ